VDNQLPDSRNARPFVRVGGAAREMKIRKLAFPLGAFSVVAVTGGFVVQRVWDAESERYLGGMPVSWYGQRGSARGGNVILPPVGGSNG
jgi:hypothetical protein